MAVWVSEALALCPDAPPEEPCPAEASREALVTPDFDLAALDPAAIAEEGAAALARSTGLAWTRAELPGADPFLDPVAVVGEPPRPAAVYVVEVVPPGPAAHAVLSVSTTRGAVWAGGELRAVNRQSRRAIRRHSQVTSVRTSGGGTVVVYKISPTDGRAWHLYREWRVRDDVADVLDDAVTQGAYAHLSTDLFVPEGARRIGLEGPMVRIDDGPEVTFEWLTLDGELLERVAVGPVWPDSLDLPGSFEGLAVLRTRVTDPASGAEIYREEAPLLRRAAARRLAGELLREAPARPSDPVLAARRDAVERAFGPGTADSDDAPRDRVVAYGLLNLHRRLRMPDRFHLQPGPQIWGYRRPSDGTVQPFWLSVPADLIDETGAIGETAPLPLLFSVSHAEGDDYWLGRGRQAAFNLQRISGRYRLLGVPPHLDGVHDFAEVGRVEIPAVVESVAGRLPVDTTRVGLLVWSRHGVQAIHIAADPRVPLSRVALLVPALGGVEGLRTPLREAARVRPGAQWTLWSGADDDRVRRSYVERLLSIMREAGLDATWEEVPHTTHLGGTFDPIQARFARALLEGR